MEELEILVESADGTDLSKEKPSQCLACSRPQKIWLEFCSNSYLWNLFWTKQAELCLTGWDSGSNRRVLS